MSGGFKSLVAAGLLSIVAGDDDPSCGGLAGHHADAGRFVAVERNASYGGFGVGLDFLFGLSGSVPVAEEETAVLDVSLEVVVAVAYISLGGLGVAGFLVDVCLNFLEERRRISRRYRARPAVSQWASHSL